MIIACVNTARSTEPIQQQVSSENYCWLFPPPVDVGPFAEHVVFAARPRPTEEIVFGVLLAGGKRPELRTHFHMHNPCILLFSCFAFSVCLIADFSKGTPAGAHQLASWAREEGEGEGKK